jgi:DNA-binding transcriptional ArsR family regulator
MVAIAELSPARPSDIARHTFLDKRTVSAQLMVLKRKDVVISRQDGRNSFYAICDQELAEYLRKTQDTKASGGLTVNERTRKELYDLATEQQRLTGLTCCQSHEWRLTAEMKLHGIASEILGRNALTPEIFPAIFGDEAGLLDCIKNLCNFWEVAARFSLTYNFTAKALASAIAEIRNANRRIPFDIDGAINGTLSSEQVCQYTYLGALLWDFAANEIVINPLWVLPWRGEDVALIPRKILETV